MSIENSIYELEDLLENSWGLPLTGGKTIVDSKIIKEILEDIRESLPSEIKQACAVVADRNRIIKDAERDAEKIIEAAKNKARIMIDESEIVRQAEKKSAEILHDAKSKSSEMRVAASDYVDDLIKRVEASLTSSLSELKSTRQSINESQSISFIESNNE